MTSKPWIRALLTCVASTAACAPASDDDATEMVTANISLTSPDVRCVSVKAVGATTLTTQADVEGQTTSTLALAGLAAGATTFTASAFSVKCASSGTAAATYVSDPITATVVVGTPLSLSFKMRSATAAGTGKAILDFPSAAGHTEDFGTWDSTDAISKITAGPDGNLWFLQGTGGVGVMSSLGTMQKLFSPLNPNTGTPYLFYHGAFGPDGNLWFIDYHGFIGRMTTTGSVRSFFVGNDVGSIASGPDGQMWFTDPLSNRVGKITTLGAPTTWQLSVSGCYPMDITAGPDGNLWFTQYNGNKVSRISPTAVEAPFLVPTATSHPWGIVAGPDGNLWFTEYTGNKVGRITTAGVITEYALPAPSLQPTEIVRGADGFLWVACAQGAIAKVSTAGVITLYPAGIDSGNPTDVATGPDGNVWIAEGPRVGRLTP